LSFEGPLPMKFSEVLHRKSTGARALLAVGVGGTSLLGTCLLGVGSASAASLTADKPTGKDVTCIATSSSNAPRQFRALGHKQKANAAIVIETAARLGLPTRAAVIGVATSMQESQLRNLNYGDRDSLGLFQQRPSQGWGTRKQILNPKYSARKFYQGLETISHWKRLPLTRAAQAVQRSGFPDAYAKWEKLAKHVVKAHVCKPRDPQTDGQEDISTQAIAVELPHTVGIPSRGDLIRPRSQR
jgi:hypothetical protein